MLVVRRWGRGLFESDSVSQVIRQVGSLAIWPMTSNSTLLFSFCNGFPSRGNCMLRQKAATIFKAAEHVRLPNSHADSGQLGYWQWNCECVNWDIWGKGGWVWLVLGLLLFFSLFATWGVSFWETIYTIPLSHIFTIYSSDSSILQDSSSSKHLKLLFSVSLPSASLIAASTHILNIQPNSAFPVSTYSFKPPQDKPSGSVNRSINRTNHLIHSLIILFVPDISSVWWLSTAFDLKAGNGRCRSFVGTITSERAMVPGRSPPVSYRFPSYSLPAQLLPDLDRFFVFFFGKWLLKPA